MHFLLSKHCILILFIIIHGGVKMALTNLHQIGNSKRVRAIGTKAEHLLWLIHQGYRVPSTHVLPYDFYELYRKDKKGHRENLKNQLDVVLNPSLEYAVRSSANVEDQKSHSFAGQFKSILHRSGLNSVLDAVEEVLQGVDTPKIQAYLEKVKLDSNDLKMAVILQEMVPPVISGVAFSKNPMTGLNEIVIEAVRGSGEALLQGGATPDRWVHKWGGWLNRPTDSGIDEGLLAEVVGQTKEIAEAYGVPVDLEWVYDGRDLHWVQLREITGLEDIPIYSNRIAREQLPGVIKPLIWSVNVPLVNSAWVQLFTELIGPNDIDPNSLAKAFHYQAYFNMGTIGRIFEALGFPYDSLELLMGLTGDQQRPSFRPTLKTLRHIPRILRFFIRAMGYSRQVKVLLPELQSQHDKYAKLDLVNMEEQDLLSYYDELYDVNVKAAYVNIVVPLLMNVYNAMFKKRLSSLGIDIAEFDLTKGLRQLEEYDPNVYLERLNKQYEALDPNIQVKIASASFDDFRQLPGIQKFQMAVETFIRNFGHLSESGNDFSKVPWRENGDLVLEMIMNYKPPQASRKRLVWEDLKLGLLRRFQFQSSYKRARHFRLYREAISSQYTFGYGLFRGIFMTLGERFKERDLIDRAEDIFFLYLDEVKRMTEKDVSVKSMRSVVLERREEMEASRGVVLPEVIYGDDPPPLEAKGEGRKKLTGIPTSRGYYQGRINVIQKVTEFNKMQKGDILVIPYSDVAWTPLFAKAGAVIAESGGILSHSSIVAREYGIPCVVSVSSACKLSDDVVVKVDGYSGEITLIEEEI
jgi:phosphohistidine swiveling domain-containing protein